MSGRPRSNEALLRQQANRESNARTHPRHLQLAIERAGTVGEDTVFQDFSAEEKSSRTTPPLACSTSRAPLTREE